MNKLIIPIIFSVLFSIKTTAQAGAFTDPAQGFNKMMLDKSGDGGAFDRVGAYKVKGTPLLFGSKFPGVIYLKDNYYKDIFVSYNTFSQDLTIYDKDNKAVANKKANEVDSFNIDIKITDYKASLKFISASLLGLKDNYFLQPLTPKQKYSLYKKYKGDLAIVNDNILQADLRQYDLMVEYYYTEEGVAGLKKIKLTNNAVIKEFKKIKDVSPIVNEGSFVFNPEVILLSVFEEINK